MKTSSLLLSLVFLFLSKTNVPAQIRSDNPSVVRAISIGISDYEHEKIPDLKYADRDARAFAEWIMSSSTDKIPSENVKVLTNKEATLANIIVELTKLKEECQSGDRVFIYFSGHGDVEIKAKSKKDLEGFLLCYDSPASVYNVGALSVNKLNEIVDEISRKGIHVFLFTDACHAGTLAGNSVRGTELTSHQLKQRYHRETKILSCEPDQVSLEGDRWGEGRSLFSYYLLLGLSGLADRNDDLKISLKEINRFLEDSVSTYARPIIQEPLTRGKKAKKITSVSEGMIEKRKWAIANNVPVFNGIVMKGIEEMELANVDSNTQVLYGKFLTALNQNRLLEPAGQSAYDFYNQYPNPDEEEPERLQDLMKFKLSKALLYDAQQVIIAYLETDPEELKKRNRFEKNYSLYPRYLHKAAELLGDDHFHYPKLMAKLNYFKGLGLRLEADNSTKKDSLYNKALEFQNQAISFDHRAPYIFNEIGVLNTRLKNSETAIRNYEKAITLAPTWGLPYINQSIEHYYSGSLEKAKDLGNKALELMPNYPELYNLVAWIHADFDGYSNKSGWERKGVELKSDYLFHFNNSLTPKELALRYQKSIELLEHASQLDSTFFAIQCNLGLLYYEIRDLKKSKLHLQKAIALDTSQALPYLFLGSLFKRQKAYEKGVAAFQKGIDLLLVDNQKKEAARYYNSLGLLYQDWQEYEEAKNQYLKALELQPDYNFAHSNLGQVLRITKEFRQAEFHRMKAFNINSPASYKLLGDLYKDMYRHKDAEWMYQKTSELEPNFQYLKAAFFDLYKVEGIKLYENKQYELADEFLQKSIELYSPVRARDLRSIGYFYRLHSETEKAEALYLRAKDLEPKSRLAYTNLGMLYYDQGDTTKGQAMLDTGFAITNDVTILQFKWYMYLYERDYEKGEEVMQEMVKLSSKYEGLPEVMIFLKENNYKLLDSLISVKSKLINRLPPYIQVRIKTRLGKYEEAVEILKSRSTYLSYHMIDQDSLLKPLHNLKSFQEFMQESFPEKFEGKNYEAHFFPEHAYKLSKIHDDNKAYEMAINVLERSLDSIPASGDVLYLLCQLKTKQGKYSEALDYLKQNLLLQETVYENLIVDPVLDPLKIMPEFGELMKMYFPEQF